MHSRSVRAACAGRFTEWRLGAVRAANRYPIARRRDEVWPSHRPSPRSRNPTIALTDGVLDVARRGRNDPLGAVPSTPLPQIRLRASLHTFLPTMRRSRAATIAACPQTHLHRFREDAETLSATTPSHPLMFCPVHRTRSLVARSSPRSASPPSGSAPALHTRRRRALSHR
ncbi:hypothetical protein DFH08DRAFT_951429 [Mycena albidolilacea]|uniref:Uncharacterized protein n=1 Tax=Mycena albidolilacea TaxID=1033008 RepID=A0AAD7AJH7_9AGAR|nr:hypothetical protein DFH08DRAFT_951429 [Mycena albidolilacea]